VPEFGLVARSRPAPGEKADRGSMTLIMLAGWLGMMGAFVVARIPAFVIRVVRRLVRGRTGNAAKRKLLRRHCWRMLGKHFTGDVKASQISRWLSGECTLGTASLLYWRHADVHGTGLALTNWLSVLIITVAGAVAYSYRVRVEEQALQANLGRRYQEYMRRRKGSFLSSSDYR